MNSYWSVGYLFVMMPNSWTCWSYFQISAPSRSRVSCPARCAINILLILFTCCKVRVDSHCNMYYWCSTEYCNLTGATARWNVTHIPTLARWAINTRISFFESMFVLVCLQNVNYGTQFDWVSYTSLCTATGVANDYKHWSSVVW